MIPAVVHYIWLGNNNYPSIADRCFASWKKFFPNYEIKLWNEENLNLNQNSFVRQAYDKKKYAFVSDYFRFWILYNYGGIYLDTDVEVLKDFTPIIQQGAFMGTDNDLAADWNNGIACNPGLGMGCPKQMTLFKDILDYYDSLDGFNDDSSSMLNYMIPNIMNLILIPKGFSAVCNTVQQIDGFKIYPPEYFAPINFSLGKKTITENTYSIHYYNQSWLSFPLRVRHFVKMNFVRLIGENLSEKLHKRFVLKQK